MEGGSSVQRVAAMEAPYGKWQPWKLRLVVAEMKEGFSRDRTSSANVCGYSQNQSQGIELDVQREEGCAATKVCGNGYGGHGLSTRAPNVRNQARERELASRARNLHKRRRRARARERGDFSDIFHSFLQKAIHTLIYSLLGNKFPTIITKKIAQS